MEDTLVSFEVAKLAKEKGLFYNYLKLDGFGLFPEIDLHTKVFYNLKDEKLELLDITIVGSPGRPKGWVFTLDYITFVNSELSLYAPTQSELQTWLRKKHSINVESNYLSNIQAYRCIFKPMNIIPKSFKTRADFDNAVSKYYGKINYDSYEEALEQGLLEGLKLIKYL